MWVLGYFAIFAGRCAIRLLKEPAKRAGVFETDFLTNFAKAFFGIFQQFAGAIESFGDDVLAGRLPVGLLEDTDKMEFGKAGSFGNGVQIQIQMKVVMDIFRCETKALVQFNAGRELHTA